MPTDNLLAPSQTLHFFMPELIYVVAEGQEAAEQGKSDRAGHGQVKAGQTIAATPGQVAPKLTAVPVAAAPPVLPSAAEVASQSDSTALPSLHGGFLVLVQQANATALSAEAEAMLRNLAGPKALNFPSASVMLLQQPFAGLSKEDILQTGAAVVLCMGFVPKALASIGLGAPLSSMAMPAGLAVGLPHPEVLLTQKESKQRLWAWLQPFKKA